MFVNRSDAGRRLAASVEHLRGPGTVVLGLPRGGVEVAYEVASRLGAPLDVIVVRKLGVPWQPELAMGAVGEGGARFVNDDVRSAAGVSHEELADVETREKAAVERRATRLRAGRTRQSLRGRTAVLVDDGIATGATVRVACQVARALGAAKVVVAVPVGPPGCGAKLEDVADEIVCPRQPAGFTAIGGYYQDFSQTTDAEVTALLDKAAVTARTSAGAATAGPAVTTDEDVYVDAAGVELPGRLTVPTGARGLVLFAHGSGSSRHSPRNGFVASVLQQAGIATLLFDLLTDQEENHRSMVFDVELLAARLVGATRWLSRQPAAKGLNLGYFGASTGAAAALWAAAELGSDIAAVVSRGGRPDLAPSRISRVTAATLLIVGSRDEVVLDLNRDAQRFLRCENDLVVIPGARHLFEEPGTLAQASHVARDWFSQHLGQRAPR